MPKPNPNIAERNTRALVVRCDHCGAQPGESCWTLKDGNGPREVARRPHGQREKALVRERMKRN